MSIILRGFTTGTIITRGYGRIILPIFTFLVELVRSFLSRVDISKSQTITGTVEMVRSVFIVSIDPTYVSFQVDMPRSVLYTVEKEV